MALHLSETAAMNIAPEKAEIIILSEKAFDRAVEISEDRSSKPTPALVALMKGRQARLIRGSTKASPGI